MSQQYASVSHGRICSDSCVCCHTEIEVADQTFCLTQSQDTDTQPTSPSADSIKPAAWQCSHWSEPTLKSLVWIDLEKGPQQKRDLNPSLTLTRLTPLITINNNNNRFQRRYSRFFTISSQRRELSPTRTLKWSRRNRVQITCNTSSAYHVQHAMFRATWYEGTAQLFKFDRVEIAFI